MSQTPEQGRRLYKARRPDGEVAWVDHDELWRLQQSQAEELRRDQARRRRRALLALAGLAALVLALFAYRLWRGAGSAPPPVAAVGKPAAATTGAGSPATQGGAAVEAGGALPAASAGESPAPVAAPPPPPEAGAQAAAAVRRWADAWASQDVAAYLASYAAGFEPAQGLTRSGWERLRRQRLLGPTSIRVEIEELEVIVRDEGRAEARFLQTYVSPDYSDVVRKSLLLVEQAGEWRITAERAEAPGTTP
jgi:hypothetical protein